MSVRLPGGRIELPPLGFGCAYLVGGFNARAARRMIDMVLAEGVRHFDVAPLYGAGMAEDVLGSALHGRRDQVSIATKVGLERPARSVSIMARSALAPLRARYRGLARQVGEGTPSRGRFDLPFVEASLSESLRRLRTDRLDLLLLHEADADAITDPLVAWLERGRAEGRFGAIGVGAARERCEAIAERFPGLFDLWQYSWSPLDVQDPRIAPGDTHILHRTVMRALPPLAERIATQPDFAKRASEASGLDLAAGDELTRTLIAASIAANPGGLVLAGSRSIERMRSNIAALTDRRYASAGAGLLRSLREEGLAWEAQAPHLA